MNRRLLHGKQRSYRWTTASSGRGRVIRTLGLSLPKRTLNQTELCPVELVPGERIELPAVLGLLGYGQLDTTIGSGPGMNCRLVLLPGLEPGRPKAQALNLLARPIRL